MRSRVDSNICSMYHSRMKGLVNARVGYAADAKGNGVAYVRVGPEGADHVLRVRFAVQRFPALLDREIGYAALPAVAAALRERGVSRARFFLDDAALVDDLVNHRDVPAALTLAYVRLGCALNQFQEYEIANADSRVSDLTARARSEAAMHVAA